MAQRSNIMFITVKEIGKTFGSLTLFEELSFTIPENKKIGLVGDNGSGKSSLFKLLLGIEFPSSGTIIRKKGMKIGYLEQLPVAPPNETVYQVIEQSFPTFIKMKTDLTSMECELATETDEDKMSSLLLKYGELQETFIEIGGYELDYKIQKLATGLGIETLLKATFNQLSGGEQTKVGLIKTLLQNPDLLLLDEPTNHLDLQAIEWLEHYLKEYSGGVVIISHDRHFLDEVVEQIYELEDSEVSIFNGNYSRYKIQKQKKLELELKDYQEQQKKIKKLQDAIRRYRQWGNESGNEDMFKKAKSLEKRVQRIQQLAKPTMEKEKVKLTLEVTQRSGKKVLSFHDVSKAFGEKHLFTELDFTLLWKQRVGMVGENGTGKFSLIRLALKEIAPDKGEIKIGEGVKIGYLPQKISFPKEEATVLATFRSEIGMEEGATRQFLATFLFFGSDVFRKVGQLSGGERMRLRLAILMEQETNLLILDEPTNHLDISTREVIEDVLSNYQGTIFAISHDRYFLAKVTNETLWLDKKGLTMYPGSYQWATTKRKEQPPIGSIPLLNKKRTLSVATIETKLEEKTIELAKLTHTLETKPENTVVRQKINEVKSEIHLLENDWFQQIDN